MIDKLMQYPLISEYLAAIRDAHDNLDKLSHLVALLPVWAVLSAIHSLAVPMYIRLCVLPARQIHAVLLAKP